MIVRIVGQQSRFLALADRLDGATAKVDACAVWVAAARGGSLTAAQCAILAGRAEALIATLPARVPAQRSGL